LEIIMSVLMFAAAGMAVYLSVLASSRPRPLACLTAAVVWAAYAIYERQMVNGVLCDGTCNIRVDVVLTLPILVLATLHAFRPGYGHALGLVTFTAVALVSWAFGHIVPAAIAGAGAITFAAHGIRSRITSP
jgi:hypothetical protein